MIINIELNEDMTSMWFFQDLKHNVHLTFMKKGPVSIDFSLVSEEDKDYLYSSITNELVVLVSPSMKELSKFYLEGKKKKEEEVNAETPKEIAEYNKKIQQTEFERKLAEAEVRRVKQKSSTEDRFRLILEGSTRATKNGITRETNIHNVLKLLELEKAGKNRKQIKDHLERKIKSLKKKIAKDIEGDFKRKVKLTDKEKEMIGEIEFSENEYIEFQLSGIE